MKRARNVPGPRAMFRVPGTAQTVAGQGLFRVFRVYRVSARVYVRYTRTRFARAFATRQLFSRVYTGGTPGTPGTNQCWRAFQLFRVHGTWRVYPEQP